MSGWLDSYYSITFNARGQKLYGADVEAVEPTPLNIIEAGSDLVVSSYKIAFSIATISVSSNLIAVGKEILYAKAQIDSASVILTSAIEILKPNTLIQITSNVNVVSSKDAFARANLFGEVTSLTKATNEVFGQSSITITSDAITEALEILFVESLASIDSDLTANVIRTPLAKVSINIVGYKVTISKEIVLPKIIIGIDSNAIIKTSKIAYAQCNLSSDLSVTPKAYEILIADIDEVSGNLQVTTKAIEILFAKAELSGFIVKVTVGKEILLGKLFLVGRVTQRGIPAIRFSPSITEDLQSIRPLLAIDNKPLTEHNRSLSVSLNQSFIQNTNWASRKSRYYKKSSARKIFSIEWTQLPNSRDMTVDEKEGRDFISKIGSDARVHTLKVRNIDSDGIDPYTESEYNVIVKNYNESLIRRDLVDQTYYWNCSLELEEV
jgi:hypothetical protein